MVKQKYSPNPVPNMRADWSRDEMDPQKRPYSGWAVQNFIKEKLHVQPNIQYKAIPSVEQLPANPTEKEQSMCFVVGNTVYIYVGTGGDTLEGMYKNLGELRGPQGEPGVKGEGAKQLVVTPSTVVVNCDPYGVVKEDVGLVVDLTIRVAEDPTPHISSGYTVEQKGCAIGGTTGHSGYIGVLKGSNMLDSTDNSVTFSLLLEGKDYISATVRLVAQIEGAQGERGAKGEKGAQGNSGVASADGVESVNDFSGDIPEDTQERVYVAGARAVKELSKQVKDNTFAVELDEDGNFMAISDEDSNIKDVGITDDGDIFINLTIE